MPCAAAAAASGDRPPSAAGLRGFGLLLERCRIAAVGVIDMVGLSFGFDRGLPGFSFCNLIVQ